MTEKSWDTLYEKYPDLFSNIDNKHSCMAFGIECNIGWYDILSSVCYQINKHEEQEKSLEKFKQQKDPSYTSGHYPVTFDQIKEKYGSL